MWVCDQYSEEEMCADILNEFVQAATKWAPGDGHTFESVINERLRYRNERWCERRKQRLLRNPDKERARAADKQAKRASDPEYKARRNARYGLLKSDPVKYEAHKAKARARSAARYAAKKKGNDERIPH